MEEVKDYKKRHLCLPKYKTRKRVLGWGILDINFSYNSKETSRKAYTVWTSMIRRTKKRKEYKDCKIADEWMYFSNFLKWFNGNYIKGYALDKDILIKGNKVYSPETCCFVPYEINTLVTNRKNGRNGIIGVHKTRLGTYQSCFNRRGISVHLGTFKTEKEAFNAYKQAREHYIKGMALDYYFKGLIPHKVFNSLFNYTVSIND